MIFEMVPTNNPKQATSDELQIADSGHTASDEVYSPTPYDNQPGAFIMFMNEWEDYGMFGYGDQNGQPFRSGEYYSWDEYGEDPMNKYLNDYLAKTIKDEKLRKRVCQEVLGWIWANSVEVVSIKKYDENPHLT